MSEVALTINYANRGTSSAGQRRFVHLEQIKEFEQNKTVTMFDIQQMVMRAKSGMSARTYKTPGCPAHIEGEQIFIDFAFYAWPSDPNLPYTITSSLGNVTAPEIIQKDVEFSATFELSDTIRFDFILEEITSWEWETECYDSYGGIVEDVEIAMDDLTTLRATESIFGVARIHGVKRGARHKLTAMLVKTMEAEPTEEEFDDSGAGEYMTYYDFMGMYFPGTTNIDSWLGQGGEDRTEEIPEEPVNMTGLSITNLQITVSAHWIGLDNEKKTDILKMEIPQCVKDLLSACETDADADADAGGDEDAILDQGGTQINPENPLPYNVYVSGCTGKTIKAIQPEEDSNSWNSK